MNKFKIAIIRENGLFYGGTEKFLQIMAAECNKDIFDVDYYATDLMAYPDRERYLLDHGVNLKKFKVAYRFTSRNKTLNYISRHIPGHIKRKYNVFIDNHVDRWKDFWNKFDESSYDLIVIARFYGWIEEPFSRFKSNTNVCEFTVFHPYVKLDCVRHHILNSHWLQQEWVNSGGPENLSSVIPVPVRKRGTKNLRNELGLSDSTIVCGFHQRKDDGLFSPIQLDAFSRIEHEHPELDIHMVVLNASDLYKKQAKDIEIKNITFIDYIENVSEFLNTLDIYTHGRKDGETYGMVITEAMIHGLPVISHTTPYFNAMYSVVMGGGCVVDTLDGYKEAMLQFINISEYRKYIGNIAERIAHDNYSYDVVIHKIESLWMEIINGR